MSTAATVAELVILLEPLEDAHALAGTLDSLLTAGRATVTVPAVRGIAHLQAATDTSERPRVYLLSDGPGLRDLRGIAGRMVVALRPGAAEPPASWETAVAARGDEPLALALRVVELFTGDDGAALFPTSAAAMLRSVQRSRVAPPDVHRRVQRPLPPLLEEFDAGVSVVDPFEVAIATTTARRAAVSVPPSEVFAPSRADALLATLRRFRLRTGGDSELAARLAGRAPLVVVVGSRKGGVGKTSHAAGMAIAAGEVVDRTGHRVAIVDANIANPDAWGHLALPPQAATVRQLATALATGRPAPRPVNATTPALACFPETREGVEYTRSDIRRLAAHFRDRYALVVVDMSNRLPDLTAGPEAAVAAFWLDEADALVLPTATSRNDFNAVLDYLDVGDLPPVVVPCIVPSSRRTRNHPAARRYREEIAARVDRVVDIPDEADDVRLAGLASVPVQQVSAPMRIAYRELCAAVVSLPARRR